MDEKLAAIYGTGQQAEAEDDLEKTAAVELLMKLAADQDIDLNQCSDEQIESMLSELMKTAESDEDKKADGEECKEGEGDESRPESSESKESKEGAGDESRPESKESSSESPEEKVAEADYLGRVMAHAYVQELRSIEKEAEDKEAGKAMDIASKVGRRAGEMLSGSKLKALKTDSHWLKEQAGRRAKGKAVATHGEISKAINKERAKVWGSRAGAAAAGAGAVAGGVHAAKKKEGSALDQLALQRAYEMAKEAGWVDEQGELKAPPVQEKEASALDQAVNQRALELLEQNGYPVEWSE